MDFLLASIPITSFPCKPRQTVALGALLALEMGCVSLGMRLCLGNLINSHRQLQ